MEDYPRTIEEFERRFSSEQACRAYIEALRWPDGFRCPACQGEAGAMVRDGLYQCRTCRRQTSAPAGTIFQDTRKPLVMWFRAMWYVTSQKNGASALGLQRVLGLGSYETAWTWLHKLRRAMVRPARDRLKGWIEVDETMVGGLEEGVAGRQTESKVLVVIWQAIRRPRQDAFCAARRKAGPDSAVSPQITALPRRGTRFTSRRNANSYVSKSG